MKTDTITVDALIKALVEARENSALKGNAVVHFCIQEIPYVPVVDVKVYNDEDGGSLILLMPSEDIYIK